MSHHRVSEHNSNDPEANTDSASMPNFPSRGGLDQQGECTFCVLDEDLGSKDVALTRLPGWQYTPICHAHRLEWLEKVNDLQPSDSGGKNG